MKARKGKMRSCKDKSKRRVSTFLKALDDDVNANALIVLKEMTYFFFSLYHLYLAQGQS